MKKFLAILLALTLVMSMTPVFAEETDVDVPSDCDTSEEVTYDTLAEQYDAEVGNFTRIKDSWMVKGGMVSPATGNSMSTYTKNTGNFAILKVDLPKLGNGQKYGKMIVRFTHGAGKDNDVAFKVEDIDVPNVTSIADTGFYTTIIADRTASAYIAYESSNPVVTESPANGTYFHYVDITKWAQESYYKGKDYVYLAVGAWNTTTNMYLTSLTDSTYTAGKYYPSYWYSFEDVQTPAALENTAEAMKALGNETLIPSGNGFKSAGGTVSEASGNWTSTYISSNGNIAIVKIDLPEVPTGKTPGDFVFRYGVSGSSSNLKVFKMPGTDWTFPGSIAETDWYKNVTVEATSKAYEANDDSIVYTVADTGSDAYTIAYANITSYIKDCYAAGQTCCYLAYGDWNSTRNVGSTSTSDSDYIKAGVKPRIYYSFAEIGALELVSSTPENNEITTATEVIFTFNNKLASATATVNEVEVPCTVNASQVTVDLGTTGKKTIVVTAADTARNTVTTDAVTVRAGYASEYLDDGNYSNPTYVIDSSGASLSKYNPRVNASESTVLKITIPSLEDGKEISEFGIRFITIAENAGKLRLFKIPYDGAGYPDNLVQTSGEAAEGLINIYKYKEGSAGEYKANTGDVVCEGKNTFGDAYHYADITTYVKECIERGQTSMLIGFTASDSRSMVGIGDGDLDKAGRYHYIYWTTEDADFSAKAPKFVASDDEKSFAEATGLEALTKASEYKFITSLANFGDAEAKIALYIAQYDIDGTLLSVAPYAVTVPADGAAADYTSANLTIDADAANVKAFIWNEANQKPMLIGDVIVGVN